MAPNDSWIGTDESGKGDYFGPLVIAAVYIDKKSLPLMLEAGVRDCKKISDNVVKKLATQIKNLTAFDVVIIGNKKYNELYKKFNNLNKMLGWAHARAIENLLGKTECNYVISDKFADSQVIISSLMSKGKTIQLEQRIKAEDDIAVAAASILARAEFLNRLDKLSNEFGIQLPKGASQKVIDQAKLFVEKNGADALENIAKLHFKSTKTVLTK